MTHAEAHATLCLLLNMRNKGRYYHTSPRGEQLPRARKVSADDDESDSYSNAYHRAYYAKNRERILARNRAKRKGQK